MAQLNRLQYLNSQSPTDDVLQLALTKYIHSENFEMRELANGLIDLDVLDYMKKQS
ncbi:MAG TPA: putative peptidoglycan binding domain-containing protein [Bacillus sp. (in: firmicutes)]|nr:putative peptidoglycan binding domain-containing protein [Bacillus sp. (in: firmicutes)]